jgi:tetratricopeptide (TPR) repeat protein
MRAFILALGLVFGALVVAVSPVTSYAQAVPPKITKKVKTALDEAKAALDAKNFELAAKKIAEAEATPKKVPYDDFQIAEFRAYMYALQGINIPEIVTIYEKSLQTPEFFVGDGADVRIKQIYSAAYNAKQYDKVFEYGKRWLATHPDDKLTYELIGNSYYLSKDYKAARESMLTAVDLAEKAGEAPKEPWLRIALSSSSYLQDEQGILNDYAKLLRYYPKADDWERYLSRLSFKETSDQTMLQWLRLMYDTESLKRPEQYMEYAQIAINEALPGEAVKVMQAGFDRKILGTEPAKAAQQQNLLNSAKQRMTADRAQLAAEEKQVQASTATTGVAEAGLGLAYFSNDQYDQAITYLDKGLKKGGLKNPDRYRMALGISQFRKGDREQARATFQAVSNDSPVAKAAGAWALRTYN